LAFSSDSGSKENIAFAAAPERPNNFPAALAANYLAFTELASIRIWLRVYEFTP